MSEKQFNMVIKIQGNKVVAWHTQNFDSDMVKSHMSAVAYHNGYRVVAGSDTWHDSSVSTSGDAHFYSEMCMMDISKI